MTLKSLLLSFALVLASATGGSAATYHQGDVTYGAATSKTLAKQTVDFITFSLDAPSGFALTGLTISVTSQPGSNLRAMIAVYAGKSLVASRDSGIGSGGGTATLSFNDATMLPKGSYTLAIGGWKSFFTADISGARSTAFFRNGLYRVTFDTTLTAIPLPAGGLMLAGALGLLALTRRKSRTART